MMMKAKRGAMLAGATGVLGTALLFVNVAGSAPATPTFGTIPPAAFTTTDSSTRAVDRSASRVASHPVNIGAIPDFVQTLDRQGNIAGYVRKGDLFPTAPNGDLLAPGPHSVYARDGKTIVGQMILGKGFVAAGVNPDSVPSFPVTTGPAPTS